MPTKQKKFTNSQAATDLAIGFSGQPKSYWDNFLDNDARTKIVNHTYKKLNDHGIEVDKQDVANIHTITLYFLGNPKEEQASGKTILIKLRCPILTDSPWKKYVFLTNVLQRDDGTQDFGKKDLFQDYQNSSEKESSINYAKILEPIISLSVY